MLDKKSLLVVAGGVTVAALAVAVAGMMVSKQTSRIKTNVRAISRSMYNFGSALQLLSGAQSAEECERYEAC